MNATDSSRKRPPAPRFATLVATWFGSGFLPGAPGTWGSLAALPPAWLIASLFGQWSLVVAALGAIGIGWWASEVYVRATYTKDPGQIVIDEVAGQWLTLAVVPPDLLAYLIGFMAFRLTDITKPWPASFADRRIRGGLGVMLDDAIAGLYSAAALWILWEYVLR